MLFGTFDGLHQGHLNFFKQARELSSGPVELIVSVARDKNVLKIKKRKPALNEKARMSMLRANHLVDKVVLSGIASYLPHILREQPDIIALGYDQRAYVADLRRDLKKIGKKIKIVRLKPYKKHIYKSSLLKKIKH